MTETKKERSEITTITVSKDFQKSLKERMSYEDTYEKYLRNKLEI